MLPGMAERTLTISSLGKTFSATGWKIGWAMGARSLVEGLDGRTSSLPSRWRHLTSGGSLGARAAEHVFRGTASHLSGQARHNDGRPLNKAGFTVLRPQGSYFIMVDWRGVAPARVQDDIAFARWLITEVGVACIPPSAFYQPSDKHLARYLARFAVCKKDETLQAAVERLRKLT